MLAQRFRPTFHLKGHDPCPSGAYASIQESPGYLPQGLPSASGDGACPKNDAENDGPLRIVDLDHTFNSFTDGPRVSEAPRTRPRQARPFAKRPAKAQHPSTIQYGCEPVQRRPCIKQIFAPSDAVRPTGHSQRHDLPRAPRGHPEHPRRPLATSSRDCHDGILRLAPPAGGSAHAPQHAYLAPNRRRGRRGVHTGHGRDTRDTPVTHAPSTGHGPRVETGGWRSKKKKIRPAKRAQQTQIHLKKKNQNIRTP